MNLRRICATLSVCALLCFSLVLVFSSRSAASGAADAPSWGFSLNNLDKTCKPCDDFYQFAMGGWMKANPIPPEYPSWGTFTELRDKNLTAMRGILEGAEKAKPAAGSNEQKIGDYYASCMDTKSIDEAGLKPLAAELASVDAVRDRKGLEAEIARLHRVDISPLFEFGASPDFKDSSHVIAEADQGGLGMPDRDYYFREDDRSKKLRDGYVQHVAKMLELAGAPAEKASAEARTVMTIETALAKASRTNVELRDPEKNYNKMTLAQMKSLTPDWPWEAYLQGIGAPSIESANIGQPEFFKEMDHQLNATPLADWKVYLKWHLLHASATALSEPFVQENVNFYGKQLSGTQEIQPRWKRCVQSTNL